MTTMFRIKRRAAMTALLVGLCAHGAAAQEMRDPQTGLTAEEQALLTQEVLRKAEFPENARIGNIKSAVIDAGAQVRAVCGMIVSRTRSGKANPLQIFVAVVGRDNGKLAVDVIGADSGDLAQAHLKTCRGRGITL